MNRVQDIKVELVQEPSQGGPERLQRAYNRIIELALANLSGRSVDKPDGKESITQYN